MKLPATYSIHRAVAAVVTALTLSVANADTIGPTKPDAVDLTGFFWNGPLKMAHPIILAPFDAKTSSAGILAKAEVASTPALSWEGVKEKIELGKQGNVVSRRGKVLAISTPGGKVAKFGNWTKPASHDAEGDGATYVYAGTFGKYGYHRVIANSEHDSPSTYFVNPESGKAMFVHPTELSFVASPNADHVFVADEDGRRYSFEVGNLTQLGPHLDLGCVLESPSKAHLAPSFRGWHKESLGFDMVLTVAQNGANETIPLRFSKTSDGWHGYTAAPAATAKLVTINCVQ